LPSAMLTVVLFIWSSIVVISDDYL
jgi:hypothetical protein